MKAISKIGAGVAAICAGAAALGGAAHAHHSFAIFDNEVTKVFTGVVVRVNPDANHLQIFFAEMNDERKNVIRNEDGEPIVWAIEMAGSAASARQGISVNTFPPGTVFSSALHPLRNGDPAGSREGPLYKCPVGDNGRPQPPEAGMHCDSVEGRMAVGTEFYGPPADEDDAE